MADLLVAVAGMTLLAMLAAVAAWWLQQRLGRWLTALTALVLAVAAVAFAIHLRGNAQLAALVPASAAIVWTDVTFPLAAAVAVLIWPLLKGGTWRRSVVVSAIVVTGAAAMLDPLRRLAIGPPATINVWSGGICMQTTPATCGPAAVATLLAAHGINATEGELARLCLTNDDGSPDLGIWRGLVIATRGTEWQPVVVQGDPRSHHGPTILPVGLPRNVPESVDPRYVEQWGWRPGVRHVVVLLEALPSGYLEIGDPAVGREWWSDEALDVLYRGHAFGLRRRTGT